MNCPTCGAVNNPANKFCGHCGTPLRTADTDMNEQSDVLLPEKKKEDESWQCKECGQKNPVNVSTCELCGHPREPVTGKKGDQLPDIVCLACGSQNRYTVKYCEQCGAELSGTGINGQQDVTENPGVVHNVQTQENQGKKGIPIWIPAGCLGLILISGCIAVILFIQVLQH